MTMFNQPDCKHTIPPGGVVVTLAAPQTFGCPFCAQDAKDARQAAEVAGLRAALKEACDIANDFILGRFLSTAKTRDEGASRIAELRKVAEP